MTYHEREWVVGERTIGVRNKEDTSTIYLFLKRFSFKDAITGFVLLNFTPLHTEIISSTTPLHTHTQLIQQLIL